MTRKTKSAKGAATYAGPITVLFGKMRPMCQMKISEITKGGRTTVKCCGRCGRERDAEYSEVTGARPAAGLSGTPEDETSEGKSNQ